MLRASTAILILLLCFLECSNTLIPYANWRLEYSQKQIKDALRSFCQHLFYAVGTIWPFLADSRSQKEQKDWERLLFMMDSTTISLFDNILKGVGRHLKSGKKKGGLKVHTEMRYVVGAPMVSWKLDKTGYEM